MKNQSNLSRSPAIVFDFGGVIFDWNPILLYRRFFNNNDQAVELFLEEIHFREWNFQLDLGYPFKPMVDEVSRQFPQYSDLIHAFNDCWIETMGGAIEPSVALLKELHAQGRPLYALSNWSEEKFTLIKPQYDFLNAFEQIVISGKEKVAKPDERIYRAFLERTGLSAPECVFIDDSPANINAAQKLDFDTILFHDADQLKEELIKKKLLD